VARKSGLTDTEAQEVVQETIISVSRHIGTFRYDPAVSSFKTWLMVVTRSRIANQYRRRKRFEAVVECPELLIEQIPDERTKHRSPAATTRHQSPMQGIRPRPVTKAGSIS
jgi:RNA polymerase sigma factor (sigma-70 family)